jgi:NADPH2:quinone reductase
MRAAVLHEYGGSPRLEDHPVPEASGELRVIDVVAAGLNPVDLAVGSGSFYAGAPTPPYVVGREGVGRKLDGSLFYFDSPVAPFGAAAEQALVHPDSCFPLPEGIDPAVAICCGIAGMAAWLSLEWRARLARGEAVLVLGASGVVGQIAIQAARLLGAGTVVAASRNGDARKHLSDLGADAVVQMDGSTDLGETVRGLVPEGIDVVIDPVWSEPAVTALECLAVGGRLVQLGAASGPTATIPASVMRGRLLSVLGHSNILAPRKVKRAAFGRMIGHVAAGELTARTARVPLEAVGEAWTRQRSSHGLKLVLVPELELAESRRDSDCLAGTGAL